VRCSGVAAGLGLEATAVLSAVLAWVVLALLRTRKSKSEEVWSGFDLAAKA
jgi:uncharacterized membrane protein YhiD involved in acid resistance